MYEIEELTAPALRRLLAGGVSTAVLPFGSIEHHGGHLPIGADAMLADAVGRAVARELGAVRAPTVRVGYVEAQRQCIGTLTVRADTLSDVAVQLAEGLAQQGFRRIALVSTHGGNRAALDAAVDRVDARSGGAVVCAPSGDVGPRPGVHSGEWLTSVMLALRPDLVELENAGSELASELQRASAERGARHIQRFVASIVAGVRATRLLGYPMTQVGPVLQTARFRLVPLGDTDGRDLVAHLGDPATVEHMDIEALVDLPDAEAIIAWAAGLLATSQGVRWAIRDHAGAFVGTAGFNALVRERASRGELAYDVVRPRWRQGVMAEVLPALLAYGYGELGLHRIEALVTPGNIGSARLLERFRFVREATLRDYAFWKGRFWDQWLYARLADDA